MSINFCHCSENVTDLASSLGKRERPTGVALNRRTGICKKAEVRGHQPRHILTKMKSVLDLS